MFLFFTNKQVANFIVKITKFGLAEDSLDYNVIMEYEHRLPDGKYLAVPIY